MFPMVRANCGIASQTTKLEALRTTLDQARRNLLEGDMERGCTVGPSLLPVKSMSKSPYRSRIGPLMVLLMSVFCGPHPEWF